MALAYFVPTYLITVGMTEFKDLMYVIYVGMLCLYVVLCAYYSSMNVRITF